MSWQKWNVLTDSCAGFPYAMSRSLCAHGRCEHRRETLQQHLQRDGAPLGHEDDLPAVVHRLARLAPRQIDDPQHPHGAFHAVDVWAGERTAGGTLDETENVENVRVGGGKTLARLELALVLLGFVEERPALLEGRHALLDVDGIVRRRVGSFRLGGSTRG